jgi:hypothetical protein
MVKAYSCTFTTPQDSQAIEAESWECLVTMMLAWISGVITANAQPEQKDDLDSVAKAMLGAYSERYPETGRQLPLIERSGVALDVIKCYLRGMTCNEAVAWLKEDRGVTTSQSVIGRRWKRYSSLGVAKKGAFVAPAVKK